jgi:hypothetical protein
MIEGRCAFPGCDKFPWQRHHVVYASDDARHKHCTLDGCPLKHCEVSHPEETVDLCYDHHLEITLLNLHKWRAKGYHVLTCRERNHWYREWIAGFKVRVTKLDEKFLKRNKLLTVGQEKGQEGRGVEDHDPQEAVDDHACKAPPKLANGYAELLQCRWRCSEHDKRCGGVYDHDGPHQCPICYKREDPYFHRSYR